MTELQVDILTEDDPLRRLCSLYWQVDQQGKFVHTVAHLAKEFSLPSSEISKTAAKYSRAYSPNDACERCGESHPFANRADYQQKGSYTNRNVVCTKCRAEETARKQAEQLAALQRRRDAIRESYALEPLTSFDLRSMSFDEAVFLLSLARVAASEDYTTFGPLSESTTPLSPTNSYNHEIVVGLYTGDLIAVHPDSSMDAFVFEDQKPSHFYPAKVIWALRCADSSGEVTQVIAQIEHVFREREWPEAWHKQWLPLWKKVALEECLEYLAISLNEHSLPMNAGEKTHLVLTNALEAVMNHCSGQAVC